MQAKAWFVLMSLGMACALSACARPITYSAETIDARVVDADTKQPLEGVVVVAHWVLEGGIHVDRVGDLVVLEAVTDKNGQFHFPAWGPIRHWSRSRLTYMDPQLLIFKSGYEFRRLANPLTKEALEGKPDPVRRSRWNGGTIELKPFRETEETKKDLLRNFGYLNSNVESIVRDPKTCNWKKIPKMLLAIREQKNFFIEKGIRGSAFGISSVDQYLLHNSEKISHEGGSSCGSPKEFFGPN